MNSVDFRSSLTFRGTQKPLYPTTGDVYSDPATNISYVYVHRKWEPLNSVDDLKEQPRKIKKTRCSGCGANLPLDKTDPESGLCECRFCSKIECVWE